MKGCEKNLKPILPYFSKNIDSKRMLSMQQPLDKMPYHFLCKEIIVSDDKTDHSGLHALK